MPCEMPIDQALETMHRSISAMRQAAKCIDDALAAGELAAAVVVAADTLAPYVSADVPGLMIHRDRLRGLPLCSAALMDTIELLEAIIGLTNNCAEREPGLMRAITADRGEN